MVKKTVFLTLAGMLCLAGTVAAQTKIPLGSDDPSFRWQLKAQDEVGGDSVRSSRQMDYTDLNRLPKARLEVHSRLVKKDGRAVIDATVTNKGRSVAFAIRVQALRAADGERILPALMNDNYFTLMQGESKTVRIEFDEVLLEADNYRLIAGAYNNK